ncbi:hypothetical protein GSI_04146 [Ganoderma sinense ZZ0214-1]|uniref:Uncharacterized protein n=1 Tax=Ganoderma sinense ZZ0214-1 TaxID=1077348 RepID=A0A2G8SID3_9APHY|nr:hypothetical protein GSI_04146 [Ganoderma sinense ZZ0214-1]
MWLLSTDRAELHHFSSPELVPGGYAILSHTWGDYEQNFQDTPKAPLQRSNSTSHEANPRNLATPKVYQSCILAERHGYRWIWNDTCCIDKTSSTELSEAINSMCRWYSFAEVCFVYMADVGSDDTLEAPDSAFRNAWWHSRGWTLQELIAPSVVIFVSRNWKTIGNKIELAHLLQDITGVPWQVLTGEEHYSSSSIAKRMSWASRRSTTRVEDEAYSLMGLFDVNMPPIYGEGRRAFQRLQQEIMRQSSDTTLFAWGGFTIHSDRVDPLEQEKIHELLNTSSQNHIYLLADSPKRFSKPWQQTLRYTPATKDPLQPYLDWQWDTNPRQFTPFGGIELPRFSFTSYGVKCRLPIIESDGLVVAVLLCDNCNHHIGLFLHPSKDSVQDPLRKKYNTGYGFRNDKYTGFARVTFLGNDLSDLRLNKKSVTASWRTIFIVDGPPPIERDVVTILYSQLHSITPAPPFRLPHWLINELALKGMELQRLEMHSKPVDGKPLHVSAVFESINAKEGIHLIFGTCAQVLGSPPSGGTLSHWALAIPRYGASWHQRGVNSESHDCSEHHIAAWPDRKRDFGDADRTVRLSFANCNLTPKHTLTVHVELRGKVYNLLVGSSHRNDTSTSMFRPSPFVLPSSIRGSAGRLEAVPERSSTSYSSCSI